MAAVDETKALMRLVGERCTATLLLTLSLKCTIAIREEDDEEEHQEVQQQPRDNSSESQLVKNLRAAASPSRGGAAGHSELSDEDFFAATVRRCRHRERQMAFFFLSHSGEMGSSVGEQYEQFCRDRPLEDDVVQALRELGLAEAACQRREAGPSKSWERLQQQYAGSSGGGVGSKESRKLQWDATVRRSFADASIDDPDQAALVLCVARLIVLRSWYVQRRVIGRSLIGRLANNVGAHLAGLASLSTLEECCIDNHAAFRINEVSNAARIELKRIRGLIETESSLLRERFAPSLSLYSNRQDLHDEQDAVMRAVGRVNGEMLKSLCRVPLSPLYAASQFHGLGEDLDAKEVHDTFAPEKRPKIGTPDEAVGRFGSVEKVWQTAFSRSGMARARLNRQRLVLPGSTPLRTNSDDLFRDKVAANDIEGVPKFLFQSSDASKMSSTLTGDNQDKKVLDEIRSCDLFSLALSAMDVWLATIDDPSVLRDDRLLEEYLGEFLEHTLKTTAVRETHLDSANWRGSGQQAHLAVLGQRALTEPVFKSAPLLDLIEDIWSVATKYWNEAPLVVGTASTPRGGSKFDRCSPLAIAVAEAAVNACVDAGITRRYYMQKIGVKTLPPPLAIPDGEIRVGRRIVTTLLHSAQHIQAFITGRCAIAESKAKDDTNQITGCLQLKRLLASDWEAASFGAMLLETAALLFPVTPGTDEIITVGRGRSVGSTATAATSWGLDSPATASVVTDDVATESDLLELHMSFANSIDPSSSVLPTPTFRGDNSPGVRSRSSSLRSGGSKQNRKRSPSLVSAGSGTARATRLPPGVKKKATTIAPDEIAARVENMRKEVLQLSIAAGTAKTTVQEHDRVRDASWGNAIVDSLSVEIARSLAALQESDKDFSVPAPPSSTADSPPLLDRPASGSDAELCAVEVNTESEVHSEGGGRNLDDDIEVTPAITS